MPKQNVCLNHRPAWASWQSLQRAAGEAGWEGTPGPAWTQGPRGPQGTSRCLCHLWVCSAELHQRDPSTSNTQVEEPFVEEEIVDGWLNVELRGGKRGSLFFVNMYVASRKLKYSCKYASQLNLWEWFDLQRTPMRLEKWEQMYLYKKAGSVFFCLWTSVLTSVTSYI